MLKGDDSPRPNLESIVVGTFHDANQRLRRARPTKTYKETYNG